MPEPLDLDTLLTETDRLRALARSILRDAHGAEDIAQEACAAALQSGIRFEDESGLRAWLTRVTQNLARSRVRR